MKKYIGNLEIKEGDSRDFSTLEEVTGYLSINSNAKLDALTTVGGHLSIYSNAKLDANALTTVGGYLSIYSNAKLDALTTVGGYLSIYSNAKLDANALTTVGGYLSINSNAKLDANALTTVGGYIYINSNAKLDIKFLKNKKWKSIDNTLFIIESEKTTKGIKVYSGYVVKGLKKNKSVKYECYVAEKDNFTAHGLTIKQAISDLNFKIVSEKLKKEPIQKDTLFTVKYYRTLTGACDFGCRSFMKSHNIPFDVVNDETIEKEPIKAVDLLPILEKVRAYGYEKFKQLITW
jgi:hypothetical protein